MKASLPYVALKDVGERDEGHAQVVSHVVLHDREGLAGVGARIVDRVSKAVGPERTELLLGDEVGERGQGLDQQRQRRCGGCDDEIAAQSPLETEDGDTER